MSEESKGEKNVKPRPTLKRFNSNPEMLGVTLKDDDPGIVGRSFPKRKKSMASLSTRAPPPLGLKKIIGNCIQRRSPKNKSQRPSPKIVKGRSPWRAQEPNMYLPRPFSGSSLSDSVDLHLTFSNTPKIRRKKKRPGMPPLAPKSAGNGLRKFRHSAPLAPKSAGNGLRKFRHSAEGRMMRIKVGLDSKRRGVVKSIERHVTEKKLRELQGSISDIDESAVKKLVVIGKGASSTVWKCEVLGAEYAVKVISSQHLAQGHDSEKAKKMLKTEIDITNSAQCPKYFVRTEHVLFNSGQVNLLMQLMDCSLDDLVAKMGVLPPPVARAVLWQMLRGLQGMARLRIVHRDIKHNNVMIKDGVVKFGDFGLSVICQKGGSMRRTFVGALCWMAPERLCMTERKNQIEYTFISDLWSVMITALYCILGKFPGKKDGYSSSMQFNSVERLSWSDILTPECISFLENEEGEEEELPGFRGIQQVLCGGLAIDPEKRVCAVDLLKMGYFEGCSEKECERIVAEYVAEYKRKFVVQAQKEKKGGGRERMLPPEEEIFTQVERQRESEERRRIESVEKFDTGDMLDGVFD